MTNRKAKYDDETILAIIRKWFEQYDTVDGALEDLYQMYCEFTTDPEYIYQRMDIHTFAKCLVACKIIEFTHSRWTYRPNYTPKRYEITKATA